MDPIVPLPGVYSEKTKILKDTHSLCSAAEPAKKRRQRKYPADRGMDKETRYIVYMVEYSAVKKDGMLPPAATWMK